MVAMIGSTFDIGLVGRLDLYSHSKRLKHLLPAKNKKSLQTDVYLRFQSFWQVYYLICSRSRDRIECSILSQSPVPLKVPGVTANLRQE